MQGTVKHTNLVHSELNDFDGLGISCPLWPLYIEQGRVSLLHFGVMVTKFQWVDVGLGQIYKSWLCCKDYSLFGPP